MCNLDIIYLKGKSNIITDVLSRVDLLRSRREDIESKHDIPLHCITTLYQFQVDDWEISEQELLSDKRVLSLLKHITCDIWLKSKSECPQFV